MNSRLPYSVGSIKIGVIQIFEENEFCLDKNHNIKAGNLANYNVSVGESGKPDWKR